MPLRRCRILSVLPVIVLVAGAGCANPFVPLDADYGPRTGLRRLRSIDRFDAARFHASQAEQEPPGAAPNRFDGMERVDVTLERARAATLENNLDLRVALMNPTIAAESVREEEARFESVFRQRVQFSEDDAPTFDVTASNIQESAFVNLGVDVPMRTGGRVSVDLTENWRQTNNPFYTLNTSYSTALSMSISHPLLRNAGRAVNTSGIRIAALSEQQSQARTKLEVIRLLAAADRSYWRLYGARRELEVRQQQYELAVRQLERARRRVDVGDARQIEVIQAEAGVASRLEQIIIAENNLLDRQRELKRIMNIDGLEMETAIMVVPATEPEPARYLFDRFELSDAAVDNRMEMLELELQLAADMTSIDAARNRTLPLITLDYTYTVAGLGDNLRGPYGQIIDQEFASWRLGLSGEIPIGNEAAKARLERAILTRLQRLNTREARRLAIRQEVLGAVDQVEANWQRIMAARQSAIASARALEAEENSFQAGASTSQDVLDQSARLADAQSAEIRALSDYQISLVDLAFATGTLLGASRVDFEPLDPR